MLDDPESKSACETKCPQFLNGGRNWAGQHVLAHNPPLQPLDAKSINFHRNIWSMQDG